MVPGAIWTVGADFNAPPTEGTYEVKITVSNIHVDTFATFTSVSFTSSKHPDATDYPVEEPLVLVSHTIPLGVEILSGTTADFTFTVGMSFTGSISVTSGWLWEVKCNDIVVGLGTVNSSPSYVLIGIDDSYTVSGSLTAPAEGNYELLINCWNVHYSDPNT
ncbi:hypothetical protein ES703_58340 [subsurface metagenome]